MIFAALALLAAQPAADPSPDPSPLNVTGYWRTADGDTVNIYACAGSVCGDVVASPDIPRDGPIPTDENNPDPALRDRPIIGLTIISAFEEGRDRWRRGRIYDPRNGESYRSAIRRTGPGTLEVQGCVGPLCRTLEWSAAAAPAGD